MRGHRIALSLCVAALAASASQPPQSHASGACRVSEASDAEIAAGTYEHDLPKPDFRALGHEDFYPVEGKRQHLQGRVLARFQIDGSGKTTSTEFLRVDAPPVITKAACTLLHRFKFDVSKRGVNSGGATYLTTVRFCFNNCDQVAVFPDTQDITITANMVRR